MQQMTFTAALMHYFGKKPSQTPGGFMQEVRALTTEDRDYFKREFAKIGIEITN